MVGKKAHLFAMTGWQLLPRTLADNIYHAFYLDLLAPTSDLRVLKIEPVT
jgi:hypothetical protein